MSPLRYCLVLFPLLIVIVPLQAQDVQPSHRHFIGVDVLNRIPFRIYDISYHTDRNPYELTYRYTFNSMMSLRAGTGFSVKGRRGDHYITDREIETDLRFGFERRFDSGWRFQAHLALDLLGGFDIDLLETEYGETRRRNWEWGSGVAIGWRLYLTPKLTLGSEAAMVFRYEHRLIAQSDAFAPDLNQTTRTQTYDINFILPSLLFVEFAI